MALFDTGGQEDYDHLRPLSYSGTNVVLICFSVDSPVAVTNVVGKWAPEVRRYCDRCPIILVACKKDLRTDSQIITNLEKEGKTPISSKIGRQIAVEIKANAYMECSAKTGEGVQDLFIHAARLTLKKRSGRTVKCQCILQ